MKIAKDTVVTLKYLVKDSDGNMVDEGSELLTYLHGGYGGLFAAIEEVLEGKVAGEQVAVRLQPEQAFGEYDADLVDMEDQGVFPEHIEIGMQFERMVEGDPDATQLFTITDIADGKVMLDGNHPLAGVTLVFACTVAGVRPATAEEVAHQHAHGPGGAHHH
jgi:FKBP-type peptidyl-prolyl cis-trans isomerase SlyD